VKKKYEAYFGEENKKKYLALFHGLADIAKELGCSQA